MEKYDVVVIGGGLGSLTTATYLSKRLRNVAVFEEGKKKKLQKYTTRINDKDKNRYEFQFYNYDLGGVHNGDLFYEYMKRCGLEDEFQYFDNDYVMVVNQGKRLVKRPNDFKNFKIYLVRHYPKYRDNIHRLFDDISRHHKDYKEQKLFRLNNKEHTLIAIRLYNEIMSEVILSVIPVLFVVGIVWLIIFSNKRINTALSNAAETLGFTSVLSKNIFRKKKIFGELDGYNCEVEVYTRSHGKSSTTYVSFFAYFPESFDMGLKINWRGEFDGDDEYITGLFIKRNLEIVEASKKELRRLKIEDTFVNSRKILFKRYFKSDEIVKTMRDVLKLAKSIK